MPYDSPASALLAVAGRERTLIVETAAVDNPNGTLALGQFAYTPLDYGRRAFTFEAVMSVTKVADTGSIQLYNLTDGEAVTGALLQTTSVSPIKVASAALTVGVAAGNLKTTEKVYEVRLSVTGADVTDVLSAGSVSLRAV